MAKEILWRIDDDTIPEPDVLEKGLRHFDDPKVGAVGGSILTPPYDILADDTDFSEPNSIKTVFTRPNVQWFKMPPDKLIEVDHLHCSYLYRKGLSDFNLLLSPVAHTEETQHTYNIKRKGYKVLVDSNMITFHLKIPSGGIRSASHNQFMYDHDTRIYKRWLVECGVWDGKIKTDTPFLDNGIGDHYMFRNFILPALLKRHGKIKLGACYAEVFDGIENVEIMSLRDMTERKVVEDHRDYNVYQIMWENPGITLRQAMEKLYRITPEEINS